MLVDVPLPFSSWVLSNMYYPTWCFYISKTVNMVHYTCRARRTKLSDISQPRAIPGCFIFIGCWIKFYPDTTDTFFSSDWLLCSPFLLFDWLISGSSQNSRGALDSSTVRAAQPAHVGALRHIKTLNSREFFSA